MKTQEATQFITTEFLAHEVRSLASAVQATLKFIRCDQPLVTKDKLFAMLSVQADGLMSLVESMLPAAKSASDAGPSNSMLGHLVACTTLELEPLAVQKGVSLCVAIDESASQMLIPGGNGTVIVRVVRNLLANAIKFTDNGTIRVAAQSADGVLAISVSDSGPGMADAQIDKLFRPYAPGSAPGSSTGLGLWICCELAKALGGSVEVISQPGMGSCFSLLLPQDGLASAETRA